MFKVYNNMAPEYLCPKFLKLRSTCDTRGSSSRFQLPLPKTNYGKNLCGINYPRICLNVSQSTYLNLNWTACFPASLNPYYNAYFRILYQRLTLSFTYSVCIYQTTIEYSIPWCIFPEVSRNIDNLTIIILI